MGKKRPATVGTMVSVPYDLKQRMKRVKEDVNWSALACQAFQDKLAEIAKRKEKKTMDDVIDRLRASKRESDSEEVKSGYSYGEHWAKDKAEAEELKRLRAFRDQCEADSCGWDGFLATTDEQSAYSVAEMISFAVRPEFVRNREEAGVFWHAAICDVVSDPKTGAAEIVGWSIDEGSPEFLRGFVDGALDVWAQVQGQL